MIYAVTLTGQTPVSVGKDTLTVHVEEPAKAFALAGLSEQSWSSVTSEETHEGELPTTTLRALRVELLPVEGQERAFTPTFRLDVEAENPTDARLSAIDALKHRFSRKQQAALAQVGAAALPVDHLLPFMEMTENQVLVQATLWFTQAQALMTQFNTHQLNSETIISDLCQLLNEKGIAIPDALFDRVMALNAK